MWMFDHSCYHAAMPEDSLDVTKMNVNSGGNKYHTQKKYIHKV